MRKSTPKIQRMINAGFQATACNLKCNYCYITQINEERPNRLPHFNYSPERIGNALSTTRLGGVCLINLCANGETLIPKEIPSILFEILKQGHCVELVTNGTLKQRFDEIFSFPKEFLSRLCFKFSFHYLELKRMGLLDVFVRHVKLAREMGCSYTIEMVAADEFIPLIDEIMAFCISRFGALCHLTVARDHENNLGLLTSLTREEYVKTWSVFESEMFAFKMSVFGEKRKEYCYAGEWLLDVDIETGHTTQCYCSRFDQNIFEDIEKPIAYLPIGKHCSLEHCYNAHALMTLGMLPDVQTPTYYEMRNRLCPDGTQWFSEEMKEIYQTKLFENNGCDNVVKRMVKGARVNLYRVKNKIKRELSKR